MTRVALLVVALAAGCTQTGTGVELLVDGAAFDQLTITAAYDGKSVPHVVRLAPTSTADLIAQLPDKPTSVTFTVDALLGGAKPQHAMTQPIAVAAHHIAQVSVHLGGGADDMATTFDLTGFDAASPGWTHQQGALPPGAGAITGIWGASGSDVYATSTVAGGVNLFRSTDHGAHWTGQLAGGSAVNLNAVAGTSSSDVYLVGDNGLILHGSGTTWTQQTTPTLPANTHLLGAWAIAPGVVYVVGTNDTVLLSSGSNWIDQTAITTTVLRGVWGVSGAIWAVGSGGTILKSSGTAWTSDTSNTTAELRAIFGYSATDVWAVGDGIALHYDGSSWKPATDGVSPLVSLRGIGGSAGAPLFAVGSGWTVLRRDPTTWTVEPTMLPVDAPAMDFLNAVFVPSATEAFAGGQGQTLLHRP